MTTQRSALHAFVTLERLDRHGQTITVVLRVGDPSTLVAADLLANNAIIPSLAEQVTGGAEQYFTTAVQFLESNKLARPRRRARRPASTPAPPSEDPLEL